MSDSSLLGWFQNCTIDEGKPCYTTRIDASQIVSGVVINVIIGAFCYAGFVLWRSSFRIYFNRLCLPEVPPELRPPEMKLGGLHQLWSWLKPVFLVPDGKLLESAGLDALMAQRVLGFGCLLFLPLTILGIAVLLPVNYTTSPKATAQSVNDDFSRMTMGGIPEKSSVLWVHFCFTYIFVGWTCFLLIHYYKEFISLRQAHDETLVRSAEVERRTSVLDEAAQSSQPRLQQIMSKVRRRSSLAGDSWMGGSDRIGSSVAAGNNAAGNHIAVRSSYGPPSVLGSGEQALASGSASWHTASKQVAGRSSVPPLASQLGTRRSSSSGSTGGEGGTLRMRFRSVSTEQQQQHAQAQQHNAPMTSQGSQVLPVPSSGLASQSLQCEPSVVPQHGSMTALEAIAEAEGQEGIESSPSAAAAAAAAAVSPQGAASADAPAATGSTGWASAAIEADLAAAAAAASGADVELSISRSPFQAGSRDAKGTANASSDEGRVQTWDELCTPFPLLHTADAAQFYTVLIVDEAREDFSYRHEEAPWLFKLPQKLATTPRSSLKGLKDLFKESKALVRSQSKKKKKQKERAGQCERRMEVAQQLYREIFGDDFDRVVPIYNPKPADKLLARWHVKRVRLDRLRLQLQQLQKQQLQLEDGDGQQEQQVPAQQGDDEEAPTDGLMPTPISRSSGGSKLAFVCQLRCCAGTLSVEQKQKRAAQLAARVARKEEEILEVERSLAKLQGEVEVAQEEAVDELPPAPCFFVTFRSAQAAAYASRLNLNPLHERMMRAMPAPAPNNVNYSALLRGWMDRSYRPIVASIFVGIMLLIPIGVFSGMCGSIVSAICPNGTQSDDTLSAAGTWFCSGGTFAKLLRSIITTVLPSILLSVWQAVVLPLWFYTCAQAEGMHYSFTALDLRCGTWFFYHDVFNVFIGGMLGGSVTTGLRAMIDNPSAFLEILGVAISKSSNFFISFVSFKGIAMAPFRLFFPHAIVFGSILKWLRIMPSPQTERDKEAAAPPISLRYSRDLGVLQLTVFVVSLGYAVVSPIILPFAFLYFLLTWPVWRYQLLYVYQGHYSSGGQFWVYTAHRIVACLAVMTTFTSAVLFVKKAYTPAAILFVSTTGFLIWFNRYLTFRYDTVVDQLPATGILRAPTARVEDCLYVPPPMRPGAVGWSPEWGKAWYGYGMPRYGP